MNERRPTYIKYFFCKQFLSLKRRTIGVRLYASFCESYILSRHHKHEPPSWLTLKQHAYSRCKRLLKSLRYLFLLTINVIFVFLWEFRFRYLGKKFYFQVLYYAILLRRLGHCLYKLRQPKPCVRLLKIAANTAEVSRNKTVRQCSRAFDERREIQSPGANFHSVAFVTKNSKSTSRRAHRENLSGHRRRCRRGGCAFYIPVEFHFAINIAQEGWVQVKTSDKSLDAEEGAGEAFSVVTRIDAGHHSLLDGLNDEFGLLRPAIHHLLRYLLCSRSSC